MRYFQAPTESFIKSEKTSITSDVSSGSSVSISVENSDGFSENEYVIIGNEGDDQAEIAQVNASVSSSSSIQVDTLNFDHDEDEPIVKIRFNQRKLYGATSKDGSYSVVTNGTSSPKDLEVDNPQGTYFEYTGTTYEYFKCTYYNSQTEEETSLDDAKAIHATAEAVYATVDDIRTKAGFSENSYLSDGRIADTRDRVQSYIDSKIQNNYDLPLEEVPELIEDICLQLSAGRLMNDVLSGNSVQAENMIEEAKANLMDIVDGETVLLGEDGEQLTTSGASDLKGYPDNSTDSGFDNMFKMEDRF